MALLHDDPKREPLQIALVEDITEREQATQALQESELRFRTLFEEAQFGIAVARVDGLLLQCNPAFTGMLGFAVGDLDGKHWSEFTDTEDMPENKRYSDQLLRGEITSYQMEKRFIRKDGEILWAHLTVSLVGDDAKQSRFRLAMIEDITVRKRDDQALVRSETRLAEAQQLAQIGSWEQNFSTGESSWSDQMYRMYGLEHKSVIPSNEVFLDIIHPDDRATVRHILEQQNLPGRQNDYAHRVVLPGGEVRVVQQRVGRMLDESGALIGVIGTAQDVTELKRAEDELRASEECLRLITDNVPALISYVDSQQCYRFMNERYREWGLQTTAEALNRPVQETLNPEYYERLKPWILRALAGERVRFETDNIFPDGKKRFLDIEYVPDIGADSRVKGYYGVINDITERKLAEDKLQQAQKMEAVGQLTGGIAHDFNNLLAVMLGNLELVGDSVGKNSAESKMIERGINAAERGAALTHRLLAFSRKQTLLPTSIDMDKLVMGMADMLRRTLGETIDVKINVADNLWPCHADPSQLENALLNLSINARDAMADGGSLTIETENISLDDELTATQVDVDPGDYVLLCVSDTGDGISKEALNHVFEPFFTTKEVGQGTGLGLSMVYGFAKQSGGNVTIYSELGEGTTVKLYLPRADDQENGMAVNGAALDVPTSRGEKILVVEDDANVRTLAVDLLSGLGYRVVEAGRAEEALEIIEHTATPIDLMLSDVVLPGTMNGPNLAAVVRHRSPTTRVVYMTGYAKEAFNNYTELDERAHVIQKPFKKAALANIIRSVLDGEETR